MKNTLSGLIIVSSVAFTGVTFAEDFSRPTNDEFFGMRDQVRTMDEASKDAYRAERQNRMMNMDQGERDSRFKDMGASGKRNMDQKGQRGRSGGGKGQGQGQGRGKGGQGNSSGSGNQYRYGQGNDSGSGNQYRYGQGNDSGSGNQYRYGQGNDSGSGSMNRYGQGNSTGSGSMNRYGQGGGGRR